VDPTADDSETLQKIRHALYEAWITTVRATTEEKIICNQISAHFAKRI
jgi:hypothetical protein